MRHLFIELNIEQAGAAKNKFVFSRLLFAFMRNMKSCSFFGHRDTPQTEELKQKVRETVERLIVEEGVDTFLFGSRSKFDELCHIVVTELQKKYPHIRRIAYLCKHETACLVGTGASLTQKIEDITGRKELVLEYEEIKKSDRVNSAGRACYVKRNQYLINQSAFSIFCLKNKRVEKSGTRIAYEYAQKKEGQIIFVLSPMFEL